MPLRPVFGATAGREGGQPDRWNGAAMKPGDLVTLYLVPTMGSIIGILMFLAPMPDVLRVRKDGRMGAGAHRRTERGRADGRRAD